MLLVRIPSLAVRKAEIRIELPVYFAATLILFNFPTLFDYSLQHGLIAADSIIEIQEEACYTWQLNLEVLSSLLDYLNMAPSII